MTVSVLLSFSFCQQITILSSREILGSSFRSIPILYFPYFNTAQRSLTKYQQVETLRTRAHPKGLAGHQSTYLKEQGVGGNPAFCGGWDTSFSFGGKERNATDLQIIPRFPSSRRSRHSQGCQKLYTEEQVWREVREIDSAGSRVQLGSFRQSTRIKVEGL